MGQPDPVSERLREAVIHHVRRAVISSTALTIETSHRLVGPVDREAGALDLVYDVVWAEVG